MAGHLTPQPASHTGHIVLGQGRRVTLGGARPSVSFGPVAKREEALAP